MLSKETQAGSSTPSKQLQVGVRGWRLAQSVFELCQNLPNKPVCCVGACRCASSRFLLSAVCVYLFIGVGVQCSKVELVLAIPSLCNPSAAKAGCLAPAWPLPVCLQCTKSVGERKKTEYLTHSLSPARMHTRLRLRVLHDPHVGCLSGAI